MELNICSNILLDFYPHFIFKAKTKGKSSKTVDKFITFFFVVF